jgi:hypothetical protein
MKTPELVQILGNLVKNDFDKWVQSEMKLSLSKDQDPFSQKYFFGITKEIISNDAVQKIFLKFQTDYDKYGIGIAISPNCMMIGMSHMTDDQCKQAINKLTNNIQPIIM